MNISKFFLCALALTFVITGSYAGAQTPSADPAFEVAAIKPFIRDYSHGFDGSHFWAHISGDRASFWNMSLDSLIVYALNTQGFQVVAPEWAKSDHFDIDATMHPGATRSDARKMLLTLLKDRFKLTYHTEQRELEGYALVVGKHPEKLKPSLPDPLIPVTPLQPGDTPPRPAVTRNPDGSTTIDLGKAGTQTSRFDSEKSSMHWEQSRMSMEQLASRLIGCVPGGQHNVVNQTGLEGNFQLAYDCPMGGTRIPTDDSSLPSEPEGSLLNQSLDAMGLKLEKRRMSMKVYIVDHLEKPSEN